MMNKSLLYKLLTLLCLELLTKPLFAICPTPDANGNIILSSQAAIDSFVAHHSDCPTIPASLIIGNVDVNNTPSNIANISGLSFITAISGDLIVRFNPLLTHLNGFQNLQSIGATNQIIILANQGLTHLKGLENLNPQIHKICVSYNANLRSLEGLESLRSTTLNGGILIVGNGLLTNLQGLGNLNAVNYLEIKENAALESLTGLGNAIITSAVIRMNPNLRTCAVQAICQSLSNVQVENNATACNTIAEINTLCSCANPPAPPSVSNRSYCKNETPLALSAQGSNLLWYNSASGGLGSPDAPIPTVGMSGVQSYFVSQTLGSCESPRAEIQVTIKDTATFTLEIRPDTSLFLTCTNKNVIVKAQPDGIIPIANFEWNTGATGIQFIEPQASALYAVTVTAQNACMSHGSIVVKEDKVAPLLTLTRLGQSDAITCQITTIYLEADAKSCEFLWSTGNTMSSIATMTAGVFSVTATSLINGCQSTASKTILDQTAPPSPPSVSVSQPTCSIPTGSISIQNPVANVLYSFDDGFSFSTQTSLSNLPPNTVYAIKMKDATTGCISEARSVAVNAAPTPPSPPSVSVSQPTCSLPTGSISIQNPVANVLYSFDNGVSFSTQTSLSNLPPNTVYAIKMKDATTGCISEARSVTINAAPSGGAPISITASSSTICADDYIRLSVSPYSYSSTYKWSSGQTNPTIWLSPNVTTTYSVTVTTNNCPSIATKTITVVSLPRQPNLQISQPTCGAGGTITITNLPAGASSRLNNGAWAVGKTVYTHLAADEYEVCIARQDCEVCKTVVLHPATFAIDPSKCYKIVNRQTGKLLDVKGGSTANNAQIIQWQANGGANQNWKFSAVGGGYFKIIAQHSQKVVACHEDDNLTDVYQYAYYSGGAKDWRLVCAGNGYVRIQRRYTNRYLTVENYSNANGAQIEIRNFQNSAYQQWAVLEMPCSQTGQNRAHSAVFTGTALAEPQQIQLTWLSNLGSQTDFYVVEKQNKQTGEFEKVATMNNAFYDDETHAFNYVDKRLTEGVATYRIKAALNNGENLYSEQFKVAINPIVYAEVFPNPTDGETAILLKDPTEYGATIKVYDALGLQRRLYFIPKGESQMALDLADLPNGVYLVHIAQKGKRDFTKRLVLQR
jgi:hypothetical protein